MALAVGYPAGFEDEIVQGALDYAEQAASWHFLGNGHRPFRPFEEIDLNAVDGVIGLIGPGWVKSIERAGIKAVNCSTRHEDLPLPRVGNDDEAIGRLGARHLLERGFARFGFAGTSANWYTRRRLVGFRQVIEQDAGYACEVLELPAGETAEEVSARLKAWLPQLPRPIAIMVENDTRALLAIRAAMEAGLHVPEDVAIIGVDNDRWATAMSRVPISSVALDARQIGYQAARLLDRLMAGEPAPAPEWVPPVGVVTRRSTDVILSDDPVVIAALRFIRDHCDQPLGVDNVLEVVNVSRRSLENRLRRATGLTPQSAIFQARIERAKKLVLANRLNFGEISRACGFDRQEQFNRVFKRITGLTPSAFRRSLGGIQR